MEGQTNTLTKRKKTTGEIVMDNILHRKLKIEKHQPHLKQLMWSRRRHSYHQAEIRYYNDQLYVVTASDYDGGLGAPS
jgi:hypothetical protein